MKNSKMRFVYENGELTYVSPKTQPIQELIMPMSIPSYIVDIPNIKQKIKSYATSTPMFALVPATTLTGRNVFWSAFLQHIFPWILDASKVYCAIKICQGFYKEKRGMGGNDGDNAMSSLLAYGKWYVLLMLIPWGVELFDGIAVKMYEGLRGSTVF